MIIVIVDAAMRSLALATLVWLGVTILRIRNPHIEKPIWTTVLIGALAMPVLMQCTLSPRIPIAPSALPSISISEAMMPAAGRWLSVVALIYVVVASILLLRLAVAFRRVWQIWRDSSRLHESWTRGADVRVTANLSSPATFGSTILLPMDYCAWSTTKRLAILAHERAHVRALDCQVQWLAAIHSSVFWFSPLSWWLRQHLARLAEHSSDDAVIRETDDRANYAATLLEAAQARITVRAAISIASGNVAQRIDRILSGRKPDEIPSLWQRALAIILLLPAVVLAANTAANTAGTNNAEPPTQAQSATTADMPFGMSSAEPHIVSTGPSEQWYPQDAAKQGIDGLVRVAVTLDAVGHILDALVISEIPDGLGFGAAASGLVHEFTYANPTGHRTTFSFNVKFALRNPGQSRHYGTTNFESDNAQAVPPSP
jgi:beta-lactamase regulating signal transducer with metallopeptidase domain